MSIGSGKVQSSKVGFRLVYMTIATGVMSCLDIEEVIRPKSIRWWSLFDKKTRFIQVLYWIFNNYILRTCGISTIIILK